MVFQYLKQTYKKAGGRLFERARSVSTRRNVSKLREGKFTLNIRKKLFPVKLPREPGDAPASKCSKCSLDGTWSNLV